MTLGNYTCTIKNNTNRTLGIYNDFICSIEMNTHENNTKYKRHYQCLVKIIPLRHIVQFGIVAFVDSVLQDSVF